MASPADRIFPFYERYVNQLRQTLSVLPLGPVSDAYCARRLTSQEFEKVWTAWGQIPGLQEDWRERFELGFDADLIRLRARLTAALPVAVDRRHAA